MNSNENINWREIIAAFSSYEGPLVNFCNSNNISKNQLYYYEKKFEKEDNGCTLLDGVPLEVNVINLAFFYILNTIYWGYNFQYISISVFLKFNLKSKSI